MGDPISDYLAKLFGGNGVSPKGTQIGPTVANQPILTKPTPKPKNLPKDMLLKGLAMATQPGSMALDMAREMRKGQEESAKKFGKGDGLNDLDFISNFVTPIGMAGTIGKAFNSVARNPGSANFLDNLYSRVSAAITAGPAKAQGQQWLKHLEKGAAKGEIDHTGLLEFLTNNKDRVFGKNEIHQFSQVNPVRLKEEVFGAADGSGSYAMYWPELPKDVFGDPKTYKEVILQGNLPYSVEGRAKQEAMQPLVDKVKKLKEDISANFLAHDRAVNAGESPRPLDEEYKFLQKELQSAQYELDKARPLEQPGKHFDGDFTNQIGHLRTMLGERNGKVSQILGEFQSDTHQGARTEGRLGKAGERLDAEELRLLERSKKAQQEFAAYNRLQGTPEFNTSKSYELSKKAVQASDAWQSYRANQSGILPLPFQGDKEWLELLFKRAIHEAAQNNAEEIIIPSGKALSDAVGMPVGGQKMYDKDGPNQLADYLKKQLGVEVTPEFLQKTVGGLPKFNKILGIVDPQKVGPNQWATPDLPGPLPRGYATFLEEVAPISGRATPQSIDKAADEAAARLQEYLTKHDVHMFGTDEKVVNPVVVNTFKSDAKRLAEMFSTPITSIPDGAAIPFPQEARDKVLNDGQRMWAGLGLGGIGLNEMFGSPKKKEKKKK